MRKRYPTDLSDAEWSYIEPHLPTPRAPGRPRSHSLREILDAIFYIVRSGCAWRLLPHEFPPWKTVHHYFRMEGATDGAAFEAYVKHFLAPTLKRGQVVVMDNLQVHKMKRVRELVEDAGAEILLLPPYSPDFSPIEEAFSKVKGILRRIGARTHEAC
jgi:transposase